MHGSSDDPRSRNRPILTGGPPPAPGRQEDFRSSRLGRITCKTLLHTPCHRSFYGSPDEVPTRSVRSESVSTIPSLSPTSYYVGPDPPLGSERLRVGFQDRYRSPKELSSLFGPKDFSLVKFPLKVGLNESTGLPSLLAPPRVVGVRVRPSWGLSSSTPSVHFVSVALEIFLVVEISVDWTRLRDRTQYRPFTE